MFKKTNLCYLMIFILVNMNVPAEWADFLGKDRKGKVENVLFQEPLPDELQCQWTLDIVEGFGGVSVVGDKVFIWETIANEKEYLRVIDINTGKDLWQIEFPKEGKINYPGSRCVPVIKNNFVLSMSNMGNLYCIDMTSQKLRWKKNLIEVYGAKTPKFGFSFTPLIYQNTVVVPCVGSNDVGIVALNLEDGKEVWKTADLGTSLSMPKIIKIHGEEQIVYISEKNKQGLMVAFKPDSGQELWKMDFEKMRNPIPMPLAIDGSKVFVTCGYGAGSYMVDVKKTAKDYSAEVIWSLPAGSQIHTPYFLEQEIYLLANENANLKGLNKRNGGLHCISTKGEIHWKSGENPNFERGPALYIKPYLLVMDGVVGDLYLVKPSKDKLDVVKKYVLFDNVTEGRSKMWAPMAYDQGKLFVRNQTKLKCISLPIKE